MLDLKPPLLLAVCSECRKPRSDQLKPAHGLMTKPSSTSCADCAATLCQAHSKLGSDDKVRCPACARAFKLRSFFSWLFFSSSEAK